MSKIIEEYYTKAGINSVILKSKMDKLNRNPDIASELEYWITEDKYKAENCVIIDGYTAEKLASLSPYLDGEGAFILLIELRERPEVAHKRISEGFKIK